MFYERVASTFFFFDFFIVLSSNRRIPYLRQMLCWASAHMALGKVCVLP